MCTKVHGLAQWYGVLFIVITSSTATANRLKFEFCIMNSTITVHPLSHQPTEAWEELSKTQTFTQLPIKNPTEPPEPDHVRIVCMSDTHLEHKFQFKLPQGDILLHAGDFTKWGSTDEVSRFNNWIKYLPYKHKIVIAGNHELYFDEDFFLFNECKEKGVETAKKMREMLSDCTYLQDSTIELYGYKIYGAPWQPMYGHWAFNRSRGETLLSKWNLIPEDTDILITHGPPVGHGDKTLKGERSGCVELLTTIQKRVKPKYHIFGHVHEGYGMSSDGSTIFINAATCTRDAQPKNVPVVFDLKVKNNV